ncbi:alpha-crystallin A chain-like [Glandiceps talaboti]
MSTIPFSHPFFDEFDASGSKMFDEEFGRMQDRMRAFMSGDPRSPLRSPGRSPLDEGSFFRGYYVAPSFQQQSGLQRQISRHEHSENKFRVMLDVQHFTPEEIEVKLVENKLCVHAKHEEKEDEHGSISREFTRQYVLPQDTDLDKVRSFLSQEGILTLEAPRLQSAVEAKKDEPIPITIKREDAKPVEGAASASTD